MRFRPLVELEAEVFGRKAALEAREDRERGKAESRWQQVDLGTSLQQFVSRPALDLIHPDAVSAACLRLPWGGGSMIDRVTAAPADPLS